MKHVTQSLVGLSLLLGLFFTTGCSRTPAAEIERVLNRSAEVSRKAGTSSRDPAAIAGYVADNLQAIDASGCPPDFRVAFQQHIIAWRKAQSAFANNTLGMAFMEGFLGGFTGNSSGMGAAQNGASKAAQEITSTYATLTSIAAFYGARVPRSIVE